MHDLAVGVDAAVGPARSLDADRDARDVPERVVENPPGPCAARFSGSASRESRCPRTPRWPGIGEPCSRARPARSKPDGQEGDERNVFEGVHGRGGQPRNRIEQSVRERDGEGEIEKRRLAPARGKGQHPEQVPGMERRRREKQGGERREAQPSRCRGCAARSRGGPRREGWPAATARGSPRRRRETPTGSRPGDRAAPSGGETRPWRAPGLLPAPGPSTSAGIGDGIELPAGRVLGQAAGRRDAAARRREAPRESRRPGPPRRTRRAPAAAGAGPRRPARTS